MQYTPSGANILHTINSPTNSIISCGAMFCNKILKPNKTEFISFSNEPKLGVTFFFLRAALSFDLRANLVV